MHWKVVLLLIMKLRNCEAMSIRLTF